MIIPGIKEYNENGRLIFTVPISKVYKYFKKAGLIKLTDQQKAELKAEQTQNVEADLLRLKNLKGVREVNSPDIYRKKQQAILYFQGKNQKYFEDLVQNACKAEAIKLICEQIDISEIEKKLTA